MPIKIFSLAVVLTLACKPAPPRSAAWVDPSPHRVQFVTVAPGVSLEVLDWGGSGPTVVFLSGLQDVAHGFDDFAPSFTDQYHVVAVTRRGYGASSQTPTGYDVATRVVDLRAVLDSLHLSRVALVGHSMAGDELTAFAGAYPERVSHLVYLDAAYDHSGIEELIAGWPAPPPMLAADSASPKAVQAYLLRAYGQHIPEAQLRAIGRYDADDHLIANVTPAAIDSQMLADCGHPDYRPIHAPALVIDAVIDSAPQLFPNWSTMDATNRQAGLQVTERLHAWETTERARRHRELPNAKVLGLHGANHYVFDSNRTEVVAAMREFLAGH